jgi:hypothetical protein
MQNSLSLFNTFLEHKEELHTGIIIRELLIKYNALHIFKELMEDDCRAETQNFIICYIVFLYSNDSTWNNLDKPLSYLKQSTIENLYLLGFNKEKIDYELDGYLNEHNSLFVSCRMKYLNFQKDMEFADAMVIQTHIHNTQVKALDIVGSMDKDYREKNAYLATLEKHKESLKKLRQSLLKRYEPINHLLDEEGSDRITKDIEIQSYESRLANKKK